MILRNRSTNEVIAANVVLAKTMLQRSIGLLARRTIAPGEGMWFPNSWAIHTIGMRADIDVLFLDAQQRIVSLRSRIRPNRFAVAHFGAASVVELGAGALHAADLLVGDIMELEG